MTRAFLIFCFLTLLLPTIPALAKPAFRGALVTAETATVDQLDVLKKDGYSTIVLQIRSSTAAAIQQDVSAAKRISAADLDVGYWLEIARSPELADAHPLWMASLQGHPEWRRLHKDVSFPKQGETIKNYPWVPILYEEPFAAHLDRIKKLLAALPPPKHLFLNDLQGSPSACGCGNPVCRWTADYGPVVTATKLGDDATARFVAEVKKLVTVETAVIPVLTTECEEHDKEKDALCAGVGCFKGICWKAYTKQLMPVAAGSPQIGVLLLYQEFGQDTPHYKQPAGWIQHALAGFATMPPKNGGRAIGPERLIAVLQGFGVTERQLADQIARAQDARCSGYLVSFAKIDQSWEPRLIRWK
jgi:hypothetical protein